MALHTMQKAHLDSVTPDAHGNISKQSVKLDTVSVTKVKFDVGAKWSKDLKPYARTESCLLPHVAYVLSGKIMIRMDDGTEEIFEAGDIMMLPPGHDAWTVGDEPCTFIQFSKGDDYYDELLPH
jgi:quercetin dioxygenase-like cupin family protein